MFGDRVVCACVSVCTCLFVPAAISVVSYKTTGTETCRSPKLISIKSREWMSPVFGITAGSNLPPSSMGMKSLEKTGTRSTRDTRLSIYKDEEVLAERTGDIAIKEYWDKHSVCDLTIKHEYG